MPLAMQGEEGEAVMLSLHLGSALASRFLDFLVFYKMLVLWMQGKTGWA